MLVQYLEAQPPLPRPMRQLAAILLRRSVVKRHWDANSKSSSPSAVGTSNFVLDDTEKAWIRAELPKLLCEPDGRVRSLTAAALGMIGSSDWPRQWPEFVDGLQNLIQAPAAALAAGKAASVPLQQWLAADGALLCLDEMLVTCDTRDTPKLAGALGPHLLSIASLPDGGPGTTVFLLAMRRRALSCLRDLVDSLGLAREDKSTKKTVNALMPQMLPHILSAVSSALSFPGWYPHACRLKHAALCLLSMAVQRFGDLAAFKPVLPSIATNVCAFATAAAREYVRVEVDGNDQQEAPGGSTPATGSLDSYADQEDDEGSDLGAIMIDFSQWVVCCDMSTVKAVNKALLPVLPTACAILLSGCQLTVSMLDTWSDEPDAYIQDEADDSFEANVRKECEDCLRDMFEGGEDLARGAIQSITSAVAAALAVASAPAGQVPSVAHPGAAALLQVLAPLFSASKWKVLESAVYFIGCVAREWLMYIKQLQREASDAQQPTKGKKGKGKDAAAPPAPVQLAIDPAQLCQQLVYVLQSGGQSFVPADQVAEFAPYLLGRSLWCACRLADVLDEAACGSLISASVEGLQPQHSLPVRMAACVSLSSLLKRAPESVVETNGPLILKRVAELLIVSAKSGSHSVPYLAQLLIKAVTFASGAAAANESSVTPLLIALWLEFAKDPFVCPLLATGLVLMARHDNVACAMAVAQRVVPPATSIITQYAAAATAESADGGANASAGGAGAAARAPEAAPGLAYSAMQLVRAVIARTHDAHKASNPAPPGTLNSYAPVPAALVPSLAATARFLTCATESSGIAESTRLISSAVRAFGPKLLTPIAAGGEAPISIGTLGACFRQLMYDDRITDTAAMTAGPLAIVMMRHLLRSLAPDAGQVLLAGLARRMAVSRLPSTQERLACAVAYAVVADQDPASPVTAYLGTISVQLAELGPTSIEGHKSAPAIVVWAKIVCHYIDLCSHATAKRLLEAAISRVLTHRPTFALLSGFKVDGEQVDTATSDSGAAGKTRAARKKAGRTLQQTLVPIPVRLLTKMVLQWFADCDDAAGVNDEEDGDDDDGYDTDSSDGEDGDDDDQDEAGDGGGRRRGAGRSPFVESSALRGMGMGYDDGSDDDGSGSDGDGKEMMFLSDLVGGGDGLGALGGRTLAEILAHGGGGDTDDDEDGSDGEEEGEDDPLGLGGGEEEENGTADPILSRLSAVAAAAEGHSFLASLVAAGQPGRDAAAGALMQATAAQLTAADRENLMTRLRKGPPTAAAGAAASAGSQGRK